MRSVIRVTLALDILLICSEGVAPNLTRLLPLGGNHLSQLGVCLGLAVAAVELWEVCSLGRIDRASHKKQSVESLRLGGPRLRPSRPPTRAR